MLRLILSKMQRKLAGWGGGLTSTQFVFERALDAGCCGGKDRVTGAVSEQKGPQQGEALPFIRHIHFPSSAFSLHSLLSSAADGFKALLKQ